MIILVSEPTQNTLYPTSSVFFHALSLNLWQTVKNIGEVQTILRTKVEASVQGLNHRAFPDS